MTKTVGETLGFPGNCFIIIISVDFDNDSKDRMSVEEIIFEMSL